jgi:hypothetical protein
VLQTEPHSITQFIFQMKKVYPATLSLLAAFGLLAFSLTASAQTYSGGTYSTTPTLAGSGPYNWSTTSGPSIWATVQPPPTCSNCLIQLVGPGVIHLNTSIKLTNSSSVVIGPGVTLEIDNSGSSSFGGSNSLIMSDLTNSTLVLQAASSEVNAAPAGTYDGVFVSYDDQTPTGYEKQFGNAPAYFVGNSARDENAAEHGPTGFGPATLSSMGNILPIVLSDFTAVVNQGAVDLNWTTATESNSDHFAIQRSTDAGSTWAVIGTVAAAGNSSVSID